LSRSRITLRPIEVSSVLLLGGYFLFTLFFQFLFLTVITYFLIASSQKPPKLEEVSDFFANNNLIWSAVSAFLFSAVIRKREELRAPRKFDKRLAQWFRAADLYYGIATATLVFALLVLWMFVNEYYVFEGFVFQLDGSFLPILNLIGQSIALLVWIHSEEFIFREFLFRQIAGRARFWSWVVLFSGVYALLKYWQFHLGITQSLTFFFVSMFLYTERLVRGTRIFGETFWFFLLGFIHLGASLPIMGIEVSGLFGLQYKSMFGEPSTFGELLRVTTDKRIVLFLSGGIGGPLSSFALQLILFTVFCLRVYSVRKNEILEQMQRLMRTLQR
jgi:hypothetical protein